MIQRSSLRSSLKRTFLQRICLLIFITLFCIPVGAQETYSSDFEGQVGIEWSANRVAATPRGLRRYLGQFGNDQVVLSLHKSQEGNVTLRFDLFIINTWDGNYNPWGPDYFSVKTGTGQVLLNATFSNVNETKQSQSYPQQAGSASFPAGTGASERNTLGYSSWGDSVYRIELTFAHPPGPVELVFEGKGLQGIADESWGIDNVQVFGASLDFPCSKEVNEEISRLRYQINMIEDISRFNDVMAAIRDHVRPTDLVEKAIDEPGVGRLMREALSLGEKLTSEIKLAPKFAKTASERAKLIQQVSAVGDLPTRLARAVATARTSSGSDKLKDLSNLLKDARILIGVIVTVNPVIGAYLSILEKAVSSIAESAKVIEAATARTNWAIEQAEMALGKAEEAEQDDPGMNGLLNYLEAEAREREKECEEAAYDEVNRAEDACATSLGNQSRYFRDLGIEVVRNDRTIARLEAARSGLLVGEKFIRTLVQNEENELRRLETAYRSAPTPEARLAARNKIPGQRLRVESWREKLSEFIGSKERLLGETDQKLGDLRAIFQRKQNELNRFVACVGEELKNAKHADEAFLITRFPAYIADD